MTLISFEMYGKEAHFRLPYTNSSRMTYIFPPRPSITGALAGILGRERDSYYDEFSVKNIGIGIRLNSNMEIRTVVTNMMKDWTKIELNSKKLKKEMHQQIPIQYVVNSDNTKNISYYIYIESRSENGEKTINELYDRLINNKHIYPLCLGIRNCFGYIKNIQRYDNIISEDIDSIIELKNLININNISKKTEMHFAKNIHSENITSGFDMKDDKKLGKYRVSLPHYNLISSLDGNSIICHYTGRIYRIEDEIINFIDETE